MTKSSQKQI